MAEAEPLFAKAVAMWRQTLDGLHSQEDARRGALAVSLSNLGLVKANTVRVQLGGHTNSRPSLCVPLAIEGLDMCQGFTHGAWASCPVRLCCALSPPTQETAALSGPP